MLSSFSSTVVIGYSPGAVFLHPPSGRQLNRHRSGEYRLRVWSLQCDVACLPVIVFQA